MDDDKAINDIFRKIEREKALINAAVAMRQSTDNPSHRQRIESQIREGRKNLGYLEDRMREVQSRKMNQNMQNMSLGGGAGGPPQPPPKEGEYGRDSGGYGNPGPGGYSQIGNTQIMPPRAPFAPGGPGSTMPKARPNYSKLDLIKYDTPHVRERIQLMLSQLEFKLSLEKQFKDGIEKMVRLYQLEGDRKSRQDAESKRIESAQKIQLLQQALKRYSDLHVDIDDADQPDDDSINAPNMRKPLSGQLSLRIVQVRDVDHAATSKFSRGPETFVVVKVEDVVKIKTRTTRIDKWETEGHEIPVDKANEIELTVYDKPSDHPIPIGMLWIRLSDIAEEIRRKKLESEMGAGWVSAQNMDNRGGSISGQPSPYGAPQQYPPPPGQQPQQQYGGFNQPNQMQQNAPPAYIDAWFQLEPVGQIHIVMNFSKQTRAARPNDAGLGRKGAIRQRKEEIHDVYGHKFVTQQFYNIMRCALCGEFLKYSAGMQCTDCKYTCHKKCYTKVVTKCISRANAETDPEEEKLNHRIPHRFEPFANVGANWCCHCGYMLPLGKKNARKCTECSLTCHAHCVHLVPDFCGMSMEKANQILMAIKNAKKHQTTASTSSMGSKMRPPSKQSMSTGNVIAGPQHQQQDSYQGSPQRPYDPPRTASYPPPQISVDAAKSSLAAAQQNQQNQNMPGQQTAAIAAAAAIQGRPSQPVGNQSYQSQQPDQIRPGPGPGQGSYGAPPGYDNYQQAPQPPSHQKYDPGAYAAINQQQQQQQSMRQPQSQPQPGYGQYPPAQQQQALPPPQVAQPPQQQVAPPQQKAVDKRELETSKIQQRIGLDHFNFLAVLGKGNFGKVMLAEAKSSKKLFAIKVLKKEFIIENDEVESTRSEKRVFLVANKERHPFLLNLHACFQTETRVYFVMEYISGGDLMLHIQRGQFGLKRAQFYAAEVCLALKYFHENGVIYRDLKLDNILLTLEGHIKIADYGLCKEDMWYGSTTSTFCGTPEFMAPEILLDKKYGRAVDWWAFGVLIYQMLLQQSPFRGEDEDEIYDAILADEPLYPIHMPRDSVSILQKLLTREPEARLGSGPTDAQEIMSHAFFRNVNWEDIYNRRIPPPFIPTITSAADTSNFDPEFTSVTPVLTPVQSVLTQAMQEEFRGFSYSADYI